jgi:hypothetical protein
MNQIDLIIEVLDNLTHGNYNPQLALEALAAARELKALQPVAWMAWNMPDDRYEITTDKRRLPAGTPLYALDEVTK